MKTIIATALNNMSIITKETGNRLSMVSGETDTQSEKRKAIPRNLYYCIYEGCEVIPGKNIYIRDFDKNTYMLHANSSGGPVAIIVVAVDTMCEFAGVLHASGSNEHIAILRDIAIMGIKTAKKKCRELAINLNKIPGYDEARTQMKKKYIG